MLDFINTQKNLHARTVDFTLQDYLFVLQVVFGEEPRIAYANIYDAEEFIQNLGGEEEEAYLEKQAMKAELQLEKRGCKALKDYLEIEYDAEIQSRASVLKNYKFTGADVQQLLANLLHSKVADGLDEASVKDVLALIKSMYDNGALDGSDAFDKHFVTIPNKYNTLCPKCNREGYAVEGLDFRCEHCGNIAKWSETDHRYYPQLGHL